MPLLWKNNYAEVRSLMKSIHVTPHPDGGWQVKNSNGDRAIVRTTTQREAINYARPLSKSQGKELVIHRPTGQIREKDSHGHDPFPPRG